MARCRECNAKVWRSAEYCQQCGVRYPAKGFPATEATRSRSGCSTLIGIVVLIVIVFAVLRSGDNGGSVQTLPACQSDWTKCADNADIVNHYSRYSNAQVACKLEANKRARYGTPVWPWLAFSSFRVGSDYVKTGTAILIEPDAQFQNGFGAMVHSRVTCVYDLRAGQVLNVDITER